MRLIAGLFVVGLMLAVAGTAIAVTVNNSSAVTLTGGSKYNVSDGGQWAITFYGINMSGMASGAMNLTLGDNSSGSGWENFSIQLHKDAGGTQLYLAQAYDKWWIGGPISSHGFNPGAVTGAFDIRAIIQQNPGDTWNITPQYFIPTGSGNALDGSIGGLNVWHTFYDGPYTSAFSFDLTVLQAWTQLDPGSTSSSDYATIQGASVQAIPEPLTMAGLMLGIGGLVGYVRKRRKA